MRRESLQAADQARADLEWLRHVGAVRSVAEDEDGGFVVELPSRRLLAMTAETVPAFRVGVLTGWRLPRPAVSG